MRTGCALIALTGGYRSSSKEISPVAVGINHFFRPSAHGALYLTCGFGPPGRLLGSGLARAFYLLPGRRENYLRALSRVIRE